MKKLVENNYLQVDFNVAFKTPKTIGSLFPFKDNIKNIEEMSHVVYKIKCKNHGCGAEYIGKTDRILCHRIKEHKECKTSSCCQHEENEGHRMYYENVEVIDRANQI